MRLGHLSCLVACALWLAGCEDKRGDPGRDGGPTEPSPNASILPAPLATGPELTADLEPDAGRAQSDAAAPDGGPLPVRVLREDRALPSDALPRDTSGVTLWARFRWPDVPVPRVPETNSDALVRARAKTEFDVTVELAALGRMRMILSSPAFALPQGTELRAGTEYYGHLVVWPAARAYTPLSPGMLRALLSERRTDVVPLVAPKLELGDPGNLLGLPTERFTLRTAVGKLELEQAQMAVAGSGATLLCRFLLELIAAKPDATVCSAELAPLRGEFAWSGGGRLGFEVSRVSKKQELDASSLLLPPEQTEFRRTELPGAPPSMLLSEAELAEFRTRPAPRVDRLAAGAPKEGVFVANRADTPRYVLVDEVPVAWLRPGAEQLILGLAPGKYLLSARDFLGGQAPAGKIVELPTRYVIGEEIPAK